MRAFCIDAYIRLIKGLSETGRPFVGFDPDGAPGLLLRHDVDYCLSSAERMAEIDHELGVKATFFIQVSSSLYNPAERRERGVLGRIAALGHDVGLHYFNAGGPLEADRLEEEFALLSTLLPEAGRVVAWHNPMKDLSGINREVEALGFACAYAGPWFGPDRYVSDSNARNTADDILDSVRAKDAKYVQCLLHPIIWTVEGRDMLEKLKAVFSGKIRALEEGFRENAVWRREAAEGALSVTLDPSPTDP